MQARTTAAIFSGGGINWQQTDSKLEYNIPSYIAQSISSIYSWIAACMQDNCRSYKIFGSAVTIVY